MRRLRFIHFADLHLDAPFMALRSEVKAERRRNDLLRAFDRIIETAKNEKPDIILICGDLFEHRHVRKTTIAYINNRFCEISSISVVILPGNHDPYTVNSYYHTYSWSSNVYIFKNDEEVYYNNELGIRVFGISKSDGIAKIVSFSTSSAINQNTLDELNIKKTEDVVQTEDINICMLHGSLDFEFDSSAYNPISTARLESLNMDYYALGHFHNMVYAKGAQKRIYNPGSPEPLGFDEEGTHYIFSGEIIKNNNEPSELRVTEIPINYTNYKNLKLDVSGCESMQSLLFKIVDLLNTEDREKTLFKIILVGSTSAELVIDYKYIENNLLEQFFYVKILDNTIALRNMKELAQSSGIRGVFAKIMMQKIADEVDLNKRYLYEKALDYGLEALNGQKIEIVQGLGEKENVYN